MSRCPMFVEELLVLQLLFSFLLFQLVSQSHSLDLQLVEILWLDHSRGERLFLDFLRFVSRPELDSNCALVGRWRRVNERGRCESLVKV